MDDYRRMIEQARSARHVAGTPKKITPEILTFCDTLVEGARPISLPVTPVPYALPAKCYYNVLETCRLIGGTPRLGWLIWEQPGIYLTAEHHAVLEQDGRLCDVTPQLHGERGVLFLPVPDPWPEKPTFTPNRYMALSDHELVRRAVRLTETNQILFGSGGYSSSLYRRNEDEAVGCMDEYLRLIELRRVRAARKVERARKKAARKRRKG